MAGSKPSNFITEKSYSLIIKVKKFSNEAVHVPGKRAEIADYHFHSQFKEIFSLHLYANGITSDDKGYVSVVFQTTLPVIKNYYNLFEFSCVFSVIDATGNKRFPQSHVFPFSANWWADWNSPFPVDRNLKRDNILSDQVDLLPAWCFDEKNFPTFPVDHIIKRDLLLSDQDDFLPGDCLRLHIEVDIRAIDYKRILDQIKEEIVHYSIYREEGASGMVFTLYLDSELAGELEEISPYFQRLLKTSMVETKTRYMKIDESEYPFFRDVCCILMGVKGISVQSFNHICQMYIAADKYDIPIAIESCRDLLTTLFRTGHDPVIAKHVDETIPTILELAETYNDVRLKENVESYVKNNLEDSGNESLQIDVETEWELERFGDEGNCFFTFKRDFEEKPLLHLYH